MSSSDLLRAEVAMNLYYIQEVWFDFFYFGGDSLTAAYHTVELPNVNVKAYIALNAVSLGVTSDNVGGRLAAGIQSYEYTDAIGFHHFDEPAPLAHATVYNCSKMTFGIEGDQAWGSAVGMLYWFT